MTNRKIQNKIAINRKEYDAMTKELSCSKRDIPREGLKDKTFWQRHEITS
ncbi:MAG: hypothetical protein ACLRIL_07125 [Fusicatenibacter saccharivorans]